MITASLLSSSGQGHSSMKPSSYALLVKSANADVFSVCIGRVDKSTFCKNVIAFKMVSTIIIIKFCLSFLV